MEMFNGVGADIRRPQELARRLSLDKGLAWKLSRIMNAGEPEEALQHMPGDAAMEIMMKAVTKAGANEAHRQRTATAIEIFREAIQKHLGDRPTLELVVDAMPGRKGERLATSRKLAFRGNSGIWGVQAKARLNTVIIAPNKANPEMMDAALIGGWIDFRRVRHDAKWVIFRRKTFSTHMTGAPVEEPLDPTAGPDGPMWMRDFCSSTLPDIHMISHGDAHEYEIGESTVGNGGAFTCFFGSVTRAIGSRYYDVPEDTATFQANVSAPVESLQFDMLVHRDCGFAFEHNVQVLSKLSEVERAPTDRDILPIHASRVDLGRTPPAVQSGLFARYGEIVDLGLARMGWSREDFVGVRYDIEYPPFPSTVSVSCPLEKRPG